MTEKSNVGLWTKDFIAGLFALTIGGIYLCTALQMPEVRAGDAVGPKVFPILIGVASVLSGGVLCYKEFRVQNRVVVDWELSSHPWIWFRIVVVIGAGIVYGIYLESAGYLISTFLFMLLMCFLSNFRKPLQNFVIASLFSILTYLVCAIMLQLSLPRAFLEIALGF